MGVCVAAQAWSEPAMRGSRARALGAQPMTSPLASHSCPGIRTPVSLGLYASLGQKGIPVYPGPRQVWGCGKEGWFQSRAQSALGLQGPHSGGRRLAAAGKVPCHPGPPASCPALPLSC